jgi:diguanylate cyclase (GGDEF)-like protein
LLSDVVGFENSSYYSTNSIATNNRIYLNKQNYRENLFFLEYLTSLSRRRQKKQILIGESHMHKLAIPLVAMASVNFYVGVYSILQARMFRGLREYCAFSLLCFTVTFYDIASIGLYNSSSFMEGFAWQQFQSKTVFFIFIFIIWFTAILTGEKKNRILKGMASVSGVLAIASFIVSDSLTLSTANPAVKHISVPFIPSITYYEGEYGLLFLIQTLVAIAAFLYMSLLLFRYYKKTREKSLLLVIVGQIIYFIGILNDSLIAARIYDFIYISEYSFFFIIISMTALLLTRYATVNKGFKELNENLEQKVVERTKEVEKLNKELQYLADYDALTGVYNRRFFNSYLEIEIKRAINIAKHKVSKNSIGANDMNFGLAIIDIDNFKQINDNFGHPVGDRVLIEVIEVIRNNTFTRDVLCRYGGDEFVLLMTKTSNEGIYQGVEKIRKEIESTRFFFDDEHSCEQVTISVGVVNFNETIDLDNNEILKLADDRLLRAKTLGRNRVVSSSNEPVDDICAAG